MAEEQRTMQCRVTLLIDLVADDYEDAAYQVEHHYLKPSSDREAVTARITPYNDDGMPEYGEELEYDL